MEQDQLWAVATTQPAVVKVLLGMAVLPDPVTKAMPNPLPNPGLAQFCDAKPVAKPRFCGNFCHAKPGFSKVWHGFAKISPMALKGLGFWGLRLPFSPQT